MTRQVGTGWAAGVVVVVLAAIVGFYWFATRTKPVHTSIPVQASGKPMPMQHYIPKATDP